MNRRLATISHPAANTKRFSRLLLAGTLMLAFAVTHAATYNVSTPIDGGAGSLRFAIINANATPGVDEITFDAGLGPILLTAGHMEITESVEIRGPAGTRQTVSGNNCSRIFRVIGDGVSLDLERMRLIDATGADVCGSIGGEGGAIYADGDLSLHDTIISNNTSGDPSLTSVAAGGGGFSADGGATITNSLILDNEALSACNAFGGGFLVLSGDVSLSNSIVSGNSTSGCNSEGGGIKVTYGTLDLVNSIVRGNSTSGDMSPGGGIYANSVDMTRSTVSDNAISGPNSSGGGIHAVDSLLIVNSTVSGNSSSGSNSRAAGVFLAAQNAVATVRNSTITNNSAASGAAGMHLSAAGSELNLISSVLAGNTGAYNLYSVVSTVNAENSLFGDNPSKINGTDIDNIANDSPELEPLADNGCAQLAPDDCPRTHEPASGSPVVNAGANPQGLSSDQRGSGFPRVRLGTADIGSHEGNFGMLEVSPESIAFSSVALGDSDSQEVTLWNSEGGALDVGTITTIGADAGEFSITSDGCSNSSLASGSGCDFSIEFQPSAVGAFTASASIAWAGGPEIVALSGQGTQPGVALTPTNLDFGSTPVDTTTPVATVTAQSTGTAPVTLGSVTLSGANSGEFSIVADNCSGAVVPAGADCVVELTATPGGTGARTAQLDVPSDAPSSPDATSLSVTGTLPEIGLTPSEVDFGDVRVDQTSGVQGVTIENTGSAPLEIDPLVLGGTQSSDFALQSDTCSTQTLAPGATCLFEVSVTPAATGSRSAEVVVASNAPSSPDPVPLSANGIESAVGFAPATVDFGDARVGQTSTAQTLTVENTGSASLNLGTLALSGAGASELSIMSDDCSSQELAPAATCDVELTVTPDDAGAIVADLAVPSDAPTSPDLVSLHANGVEPTIALTPTSIDFGDVRVEETTPAQTIEIENTGTADLLVDSMSLSGPQASDFAVASENCTGQPIAVGATCQIEVEVTPSDATALAAELEVESDAPTSATVVPLQATGVEPVITLDAQTLEFGEIEVGETETALVTLTNSGSGELVIDNIVEPSDPFAIVGGTCTGLPRTLAPGEACDIAVELAPQEFGHRLTSEIEIISDAESSPDTIGLAGGTQPLPVPALNPIALVLLSLLAMLFGCTVVRRTA